MWKREITSLASSFVFCMIKPLWGRSFVFKEPFASVSKGCSSSAHTALLPTNTPTDNVVFDLL